MLNKYVHIGVYTRLFGNVIERGITIVQSTINLSKFYFLAEDKYKC